MTQDRAKRRHHVTKAEQDAVATFAADVLEALRMPLWTICIMDDPCEDDTIASIDTVDGKHVAQLYLAADWMKRPSQERLNTIVHEVLHLVHARVSDVVIDDSRDFMHDHEHDDWTRRVRREFELMVDHLAFFLAQTHTLEEAWDKAHQRPRSARSTGARVSR